MAIIDKVTVAVQVFGQDLVEYDNDEANHDDQKRITRYVEAVSGQQFTIMLETSGVEENVHDAWSFEIRIDGKFACKPFVRHISPSSIETSSRFGTPEVRDGHIQIRRWFFSEINEGKPPGLTITYANPLL